jgi:hypothetical protein
MTESRPNFYMTPEALNTVAAGPGLWQSKSLPLDRRNLLGRSFDENGGNTLAVLATEGIGGVEQKDGVEFRRFDRNAAEPGLDANHFVICQLADFVRGPDREPRYPVFGPFGRSN